MMNKIGIIITKVSGGMETSFTVNAEEWEDNVLDPRNYLKKIDDGNVAKEELKDTFYDFVRFGQNAAFIYTSRYIAGRGGDLISAMIAVPYNIDIAGKDLEEILRDVKENIKGSKSDYNKLKELVSKEYNEKKIIPSTSIQSKENGKYAYRYYGQGENYGLHELLGELFQPEYGRYDAVFLLDKSSKLNCIERDTDNLTNEKLKKPAVLKCPNKPDLDLYIDNKPFKSDYNGYEGHKVSITFKRKGCEPKKAEIELAKLENTIKIEDYDKDWDVRLNNSYFNVIDANDMAPIEDAEIKVNKKKVDGKQLFKLEELKGAEIEVSAKNYDTLILRNKDIDLIRQPSINIPLNKKKQKVKYTIDENNCKLDCNVEFEIELPIDYDTKNLPPIDGYEIAKGGNKEPYRLVKKSGKFFGSISKKRKIGISIFGLVVCFFTVVGVGTVVHTAYQIFFEPSNNTIEKTNYSVSKDANSSNILNNSHNNDDNKKSEVSETSEKSTSVDISNSPNTTNAISYNLPTIHSEDIDYLKKHDKWELKNMRSSENLVQLYNDVNECRFDSITQKWDSLLKDKGIKYWGNLVKSAKESKFVPKLEQKSSNGSSAMVYSNDSTITISKYIRAISGNNKE